MITAHKMIFTTPRTTEEITPEIAAKYIKRHRDTELPRLSELERYYNGGYGEVRGQMKKADGLSDLRIGTDHAAYIADFTSAYLLGEPVTYSSAEDMSKILDALRKADAATQDTDLALDAAIFGRAYELVYMSDDAEPFVKLARLSPKDCFVVYDESVEQRPVFGVYYFPLFEEQGSLRGFIGQILTAKSITDIELDTSFSVIRAGAPAEHYFGEVPLDEIYNNGQRTGDFERVTDLIDAYNILQSDRLNDKEQFVNALLLIKNTTLGYDNSESLEAYKALKTFGVLELHSDVNGVPADASFLSRQFDESSVEILRNAIVSDIHKISGVPDMTDEKFAGNTSGVAMKYKLLGLEQITKTKQRFFTEGLRYRLRLIQNILAIKGVPTVDLSAVNITFRRSLPANELELAQLVSTLQGSVSQKTLLSLLPFVADPEEEIRALDKEKQEAVRRQQSMFMNTPIDEAE